MQYGLIAPRPLAKVYIKRKAGWEKALFWKVENERLVFTTNGINEITGCMWSERE